MNIWITRDKRGSVRLFQEKPVFSDQHFYSSLDGWGMEIKQTNNNRSFLKHITFENSPKRLKLNWWIDY